MTQDAPAPGDFVELERSFEIDRGRAKKVMLCVRGLLLQTRWGTFTSCYADPSQEDKRLWGQLIVSQTWTPARGWDEKLSSRRVWYLMDDNREAKVFTRITVLLRFHCA